MERYIKYLIVVFALVCPVLAMGVTQKEMEEARTIATKAYLRYANDGSGYLDDINPKTMDELEAQLKPKEKENIKAFKAIPVPTDYKDWNKEKLVEYWAVTAFQNKGLLEKGRGGRIRTRSLINKMNIGAPEAQAPVVAPETSPVSSDTASTQQKLDPKAEMAKIKAEENTVREEEEELDDTPIKTDKERNYTWVYIMALCILVGLVVALIVYASNVLKKSGRPGADYSPANSGHDAEAIERYESLLADKDTEIAMLKKKLETANRQNSELKTKIDAMSADIATLKTSAPKPAVAPKNTVRSIYLGRANNRGIFVRADRNLNVGNSVFILETSDGYSGSFKVADNPAAWSLALSNPREYLETACSGHDLDDTIDAESIVTETPGTAVFEGGCWKVIRKARIKYIR